MDINLQGGSQAGSSAPRSSNFCDTASNAAESAAMGFVDANQKSKDVERAAQEASEYAAAARAAKDKAVKAADNLAILAASKEACASEPPQRP